MARHSPIEIATGAAVLLVAAGFLAFAVANTGQHLGGSAYTLHAAFDHADGLAVGSDVRIAGVRVGGVTRIWLDPKTYLAEVDFSVADDIKLTADSSATIASESLLGGKYLALASGGDEKMLGPGGTVTITQGSMNIEALIGKYIFGGVGGSGAGSGAKSDAGKPPSGGGIAPLK